MVEMEVGTAAAVRVEAAMATSAMGVEREAMVMLAAARAEAARAVVEMEVT